MACPSPEQLEEVVHGGLDEALAEGVLRHAENCPACGARLDRLLRQGDGLLGQDLPGPTSTTLALPPIPRIDLRPSLDPSPIALPQVPGYEVLEEVGRGGMGVVYKARHLALGRLAALKMILAGSLASHEHRLRFRIEAELSARIQAPGVVQVFEVGEFEGKPFLALEWIEGGSLARRLAGKPIAAREAAVLVERIARAVQVAHTQGVVHRDLKPANILLTSQGHPKVTDFGLAKLAQTDSGLTRSGAIVGTPEYMAPEQASGGKQVGFAADVYALGCILYECLTGWPPLRGETVLETLRMVGSVEPMRPGHLSPGIPRDLGTICLKCLRKEPANRYSSAEALAEDLRHWRTGEPIQARPVGELERSWLWARRNPVVAGLLVAVLFALLGGLAFSLHFAYEASKLARMASDNETVALVARDQARDAEADARSATGRANLRAAELEFRLGLQEAQSGAVDRGLFRMVRAWRMAPPEATGLRTVLRVNLAGWSRQLPRLRQAFPVPRFLENDQFLELGDPEGRTLLTWHHADNAYGSWDVSTGRPLGPLKKAGRIRTTSRDGRWLVLGEDAFFKDARVLDRATGGVLAPQSPGRFDPQSLSVLPDFQVVQENGVRTCWDLARNKPLPGRLVLPDGSNLFVTRNSLGDVVGVVFGTENRFPRVEFLDLRTGKAPAQAPVGAASPYLDYAGDVLAFPDGRTENWIFWDLRNRRTLAPPWRSREGWTFQLGLDSLDVGGETNDNRLHSYDLATGFQRGGDMWGGNYSYVEGGRSHASTPDRRRVFTIDEASTIRVWDTSLGRFQETATTTPHRLIDATRQGAEDPSGYTLSPNCSRLALAWDKRNLAIVLDTSTGELLGPPIRQNAIHHLAFSPDGRLLATATFQGRETPTVVIRDGNSGRPLARPWVSPKLIHALAFSPDGKTLAVGGVGGTHVLDVPSATLRHRLSEATCINGLAFHPDSRRLAVAAAYGWPGVGSGLRVWDVVSGKSLGPFHTTHSAFSPILAWDDEELVSYDNRTNAITRLSSDGKDLRGKPWPIHRSTSGMFSLDGRQMVATSGGGEVRQYDSRTGAQVGPDLKLPDSSYVGCYSPNGKLLAIRTRNAVHLWDSATGWPLGPPLLLATAPRMMAFDSQGTTLFTVSGSGRIQTWPVPQPLGDDADRFEAWMNAKGGITQVGEQTRALTFEEWQAAVRAFQVRWPEHDPALAELPKDDVWHRQQASHAQEAGNERGELYHLERLANLAPHDGRIHSRIAGIHSSIAGRLPDGPSRDREWRLAGEARQRAGERRAIDYEGHLRALWAMDRKAWQEAQWHLDWLLSRHPHDPTLLADRASVHAVKGDLETRDADWKRALAHGGLVLQDLVSAIAEEWGRQDRWSEVARVLQDARNQGQTDLASARRLGLAQLKAGDRVAHAHLCQGMLGSLSQKASLTAAELAELAILSPSTLPDWKRALELIEGALRVVEAAVQRSEGETLAYYRLVRRRYLGIRAGALYRAGRYQEAIEQLKASRKEVSGNAEPKEWVWLALAQAASEQGQVSQAAWEALARARAIMPNRGTNLWEAVEVEILIAEAVRALGAAGRDR